MADIKDLKITEDKTRGKHVADLPVNPTENGMSAQELQGQFDALPEVVIEAFNTLLDYLVENGAGDNITALTVGALPITGGKLTGNLYLNDRVQMGGNENAFLVSSNAKDGSYRQLQVTNSGYMTSVKNAIRLIDSLSNQTYNIYGEHNKPTASDVGALPIYRTIDSLGMPSSNSDFSATDFVANVLKFAQYIPTFSLFTTQFSSAHNFAKSIREKIKADVGMDVSTYYDVKLLRLSNNILEVNVIPLLRNDSIYYGYEFSCVLRYDSATATTNVVSPFSIVRSPNGFSSSGSVETLWENASTDSAFAEQTIDLNFSVNDYGVFFVMFKQGNTGDTEMKVTIPVVPDGQTNVANMYINITQSVYTSLIRRSVTFNPSTNRVGFGSALKKAINSTTYETNNNYMIPVAIYGIKK